jgi:hypothetical protein
MRDYNLDLEQNHRLKISLDYHEQRSENGPENPLTENARNDILLKLNENLGNTDRAAPPDLAVSKLRLRVSSPEIREVTRAASDEFELRFVSDPAGYARDITEEKNFKNGLYTDLGFEYRNLNLRSVIETRAKYTEQGDPKMMSWSGPQDIRPRCKERLAQAVYQTILPEEYRAIKQYNTGQDDVLDLQSVQTDDGEEVVTQ